MKLRTWWIRADWGISRNWDYAFHATFEGATEVIEIHALRELEEQINYLKGNQLKSFDVAVPSDEWYDIKKERDQLRAEIEKLKDRNTRTKPNIELHGDLCKDLKPDKINVWIDKIEYDRLKSQVEYYRAGLSKANKAFKALHSYSDFADFVKALPLKAREIIEEAIKLLEGK